MTAAPTPEPTPPQLRCPACGGPHLPLACLSTAPSSEPTPALPAEAIEAAARAAYEHVHEHANADPGYRCDQPPWDKADDEVHDRYHAEQRAALTAALPFLPQHVSPSADLIAAMVREIDAEAVSYRAITDHGQHAEPLTVVSGSDFADVIAQRIYRLLRARAAEVVDPRGR